MIAYKNPAVLNGGLTSVNKSEIGCRNRTNKNNNYLHSETCILAF